VPAILSLALADGRAALKYVHDHAAEFDIVPTRVGMIGASAGAILIVSLVVDATSEAKPDLSGVIRGTPTLQTANALPILESQLASSATRSMRHMSRGPLSPAQPPDPYRSAVRRIPTRPERSADTRRLLRSHLDDESISYAAPRQSHTAIA
jgi:acetyl esterase/lipase